MGWNLVTIPAQFNLLSNGARIVVIQGGDFFSEALDFIYVVGGNRILDRGIDFLDCGESYLACNWIRVGGIHHPSDPLSQQDHFGSGKGAASSADVGGRLQQAQQTEVPDAGVD